ncbi:hypothetical protein [Necropsobacter massiliensis]|uniref:hypothetical protein n=1 Tax=Necropsobacter massiliensis TaxID=1400001 RepID=UPI000509959B|nr:hypothetical protein [Necropsobacter massiliensis]
MKKLLTLFCLLSLAACSSGVSLKDIQGKMPHDKQAFIVDIPAASNAVSNTMVVAMIKTSGSPSASNIIQVLGMDNVNIGVIGNSQMLNKATVLYALEQAPKIGSNVGLYMLGDSESDKAALEQAAKAKKVQLNYSLTR